VYYLAFATDGDGTLMRGGRMAKATVDALKKLRRSGRKLILVTGETAKQLADFPHLSLFDCVVAENGGLLQWPGRRATRRLGRKPPTSLIHGLRSAGVESLRCGEVVISVKMSAAHRVQELLNNLRLKRHLVRNRRDLMILPQGVDKATGLARALKYLGISRANVVGAGDAENDRALLRTCGLGVAVANAVPKLKNAAQLTLDDGAGRGVVDLIGRMLANEDQLRRTGRRRHPSRR
jgi:hydroxymethylpyrimidine pyrophosphatase-like HAD family hydrolase